MLRRLLVLISLLPSVVLGQQLTDSQLATQLLTLIPNNTSNAITPSNVRKVTQDGYDARVSVYGNLGLKGLLGYNTLFTLTNDKQLVHKKYVDDKFAAIASSVLSFNGRIGTVLPQAGDYTFDQIGSKPTSITGFGIIPTFADYASFYYPLTGNPSNFTTLAQARAGFSAPGTFFNYNSLTGVLGTTYTPLSNSLAQGKVFIGNSSGIATEQTPSGDITVNQSGVFTLPNVNSNIGTYNNININAKGQAVGGSNISYELLANKNVTGTMGNSNVQFPTEFTLRNYINSLGFYDGSSPITTETDPVFATNGVNIGGSYSNPSWINSLAWGKITGAPSFLTSYTETDPLAVKLAGSYSNPVWINSLPWSKITSAPAFLTSYTETDPLAVKLAGSYANPSWVTSLPWSKITGAPTFLTSYTETDPLAVKLAGSYTNPSWLVSIPYSKVTGAPAGIDSYTKTEIQQFLSGVTPISGYNKTNWDNAVLNTGSYANPAWISSLPYSKITGTPNLGLYELLSNKSTTLSSPDNTKYPTTLTVSTAIATKEDVANKAVDMSVINNIKYPTTQLLSTQLATKQNIISLPPSTIMGNYSGITATYSPITIGTGLVLSSGGVLSAPGGGGSTGEVSELTATGPIFISSGSGTCILVGSDGLPLVDSDGVPLSGPCGGSNLYMTKADATTDGYMSKEYAAKLDTLNNSGSGGSGGEPLYIAFRDAPRGAGLIYGGPATSTGVASFRSLTSSDIPSLSYYPLSGNPSGFYNSSNAYSKTEINSFFSGGTSITGYNKSAWDAAAAKTNLSQFTNNLGFITGYTETNPGLGAVAYNNLYSSLTGLPTISTVGNTGQYSDLIGKPTIPAQVNITAGTDVVVSGTYPNIVISSTAGTGGGGGSLVSVGLTAPTGLTVSGSPVTGSGGTLALTTTLNGLMRGTGTGFTTGQADLTSEVSGILPLANGGTNSNTASGARTNLGLAIGTNVQAWDTDLDGVAGLSTTGFVKRTGAGAFTAASLIAADIPTLTISKLSDFPTNLSAFTNGPNYITGSSTTALTNKTGNISQWTNDAGYLTSGTLPALDYIPLGGTVTGSPVSGPIAFSDGRFVSESDEEVYMAFSDGIDPIMYIHGSDAGITLQSDGLISLVSASSITLGASSLNVTSNINLGQNKRTVYSASSGGSVSLGVRPTQTFTGTFNLPATLGSAGQVITTDGAGNWNWGSGSSGSSFITSLTTTGTGVATVTGGVLNVPPSGSGSVTSVGISGSEFSIGSPVTTSGNISLALGTNGVVYSKLQQVGASKLLGNPTGATANASEITLSTGLAFASGALKAVPPGLNKMIPFNNGGNYGADFSLTFDNSVGGGQLYTSGQILIGANSSDVGYLNIGPGSSTKPPIFFETSTSLLSTPLVGALEKNASHLYYTTDVAGTPVRKQLDNQDQLLSVGNFSASGNSKGLSVSSGQFTAYPATGTTPGMTSVVAQSFEGPKTFKDQFAVAVLDSLTGSVSAFSGATVGVTKNGTSAVNSWRNLEITDVAKNAGSINIQNGLYINNMTSGAFNYSIYTNTGEVRLGKLASANPGNNMVASTPNGELFITKSAISTWVHHTTATAYPMNSGTGYVSDAGATVVSFSLPVTSAVDDVIRVSGQSSGGWKVIQATGQSIKMGSTSTSTGAAGFLQSTNTYDAVELRCTVANTTWVVISSQGTVTVN